MIPSELRFTMRFEPISPEDRQRVAAVIDGREHPAAK
jgi:hypothetical protein